MALLDLGVKQNIPAPPHAAWVRGAGLPARHALGHDGAVGARRLFHLERPRRPGRHHRSHRERARHRGAPKTALRPFASATSCWRWRTTCPPTKMPNGHRGLNHPVKNLRTGRCEITSQNHGFGVDAAAVAAHPDLEVTHLNLNEPHRRGPAPPRLPGLLGAVSPRILARPARLALPVRRVSGAAGNDRSPGHRIVGAGLVPARASGNHAARAGTRPAPTSFLFSHHFQIPHDRSNHRHRRPPDF